MDKKDVTAKSMNHAEMDILLKRLEDSEAVFTGEGELINSAKLLSTTSAGTQIASFLSVLFILSISTFILSKPLLKKINARGGSRTPTPRGTGS